jgi:hypothetical protein
VDGPCGVGACEGCVAVHDRTAITAATAGTTAVILIRFLLLMIDAGFFEREFINRAKVRRPGD